MSSESETRKKALKIDLSYYNYISCATIDRRIIFSYLYSEMFVNSFR